MQTIDRTMEQFPPVIVRKGCKSTEWECTQFRNRTGTVVRQSGWTISLRYKVRMCCESFKVILHCCCSFRPWKCYPWDKTLGEYKPASFFQIYQELMFLVERCYCLFLFAIGYFYIVYTSVEHGHCHCCFKVWVRTDKVILGATANHVVDVGRIG